VTIPEGFSSRVGAGPRTIGGGPGNYSVLGHPDENPSGKIVTWPEKGLDPVSACDRGGDPDWFHRKKPRSGGRSFMEELHTFVRIQGLGQTRNEGGQRLLAVAIHLNMTRGDGEQGRLRDSRQI